MSRIGNTNIQANLSALAQGLRVARFNETSSTQGVTSAPLDRPDASATGSQPAPNTFQQIGLLESTGQQLNTLQSALDAVNENLLAAREALSRNEPAGEAIAKSQDEIARILSNIDRIVSSNDFAGAIDDRNGFSQTPPTLIAENLITGVDRLKFNGYLPEGVESLDVEINVSASAQQGALLLSFGAAALDLTSAADTFTIEIGGVDGSRTLSFSSGTTLSVIRDAINTFTEIGRAHV